MRLGICQFDIQLGNLEKNVAKVLHFIDQAKDGEVELLAFPESALAGYCFDSELEAGSLAFEDDHPVLGELQRKAISSGVMTVIGYIERDGEKLYNSAGLFGLQEGVKKYRKIHTLVLGLDRFVEEGDLGFPVFSTPAGRVGVNICYDQRFPESARSSMLNGAQLVLVPTNSPEAAKPVNTFLTQARAFENRVYYAWVNRIGREKNTTFTGGSTVVDPYGNVLLTFGAAEEGIKSVDIDLSRADEKKTVVVPGEYEIDLLGDRRPEMYVSSNEQSWHIKKK